MELPADVLPLIRAFSRPMFKYFRDYNRALKLLEKKEWKGLKNKLLTDGDSVITALRMYLDGLADLRKAQLLHWEYYRLHILSCTITCPEVQVEHRRLCAFCQEKTTRVKGMYRDLAYLLYGTSLPERELYLYH